jgi:hypothetical protein
MKKIIVSILAVFYLCSSTGATIHFHYCMGKLLGWDIQHADDSKCNKCGMNKREAGKGCCKDEYKFIKIEKNQQAQSAYKIILLCPVAIPVSFAELANPQFSVIANENFVSNSLPLNEQVPIYIRNCVFLI